MPLICKMALAREPLLLTAGVRRVLAAQGREPAAAAELRACLIGERSYSRAAPSGYCFLF